MAQELAPALSSKIMRQLLATLKAEELKTAKTFGELAASWLKRCAHAFPEVAAGHVRHLAPLKHLREGDLTKAAIEAALLKLDRANGGPLGPATLNKLRSTGKLIIDDAIGSGTWSSANPFAYVKRRRVAAKPVARLTAEELSRALACMRPDRRRECLWQIHAGTRPGEQKALRKSDVDLARGFVTIHRSNGRAETKTGRSREIPIPIGAREALLEAMRLSPSELVFPNPDGTRQRADLKLSETLRTALKHAGVICGYGFKCRRKGCGFYEVQPTSSADRRCPRCNFKLWCEAVPKHFTWYGLRAAANNLHRESGADAFAVKVALGHAGRDVNDDHYSSLTDERFKAELGKLVIRPASTAPKPAHVRGGNTSPLNLFASEIRALIAERPDVSDLEIAELVTDRLGVATSRASIHRLVHRSGMTSAFAAHRAQRRRRPPPGGKKSAPF